MSEILNCPFCGNKPEIMGSGDRQRGLMIHCIAAGCVNPHVSYYEHASSIAAWNRRSPPVNADGAGLREEEIGTLQAAVENLRSPDKSEERTIEAAWRIASKLEQMAKRMAAPAPALVREALKLAESALEQAQDCINAETPEDISFGEAEDDTLSKIREALRAIAILAHTRHDGGGK